MSWRPPSRIDPRKPAQDLTKRTQQIYQGRRDSGYSLPRELERNVFRNERNSAIRSFSTQQIHNGRFNQEPVRRPSQLVDLDNYRNPPIYSQYQRTAPERMSPMAIYRDQSFQNQSQASLPREPHYREPSLASLEIDANDDYFRRKRKPTSQSTCVIAGRNKRKATTNRSCSSGSHRIHLDLTIENASEQIDLTAESEEEEEYSFLRQFEEERTPKRISPAGPVIKHDEIEPMKFLPYFDKNLGLSAVLKSKNKNIVKFSRREYCDEIRLKVLIARVEIIDGTCFLRDPFRLSDPSTTTVVGHFAENFHLRHMDVVMLTDVKAEYKLMFDAETEPTLSVHKIIISIHENDVAFSALAQPFQWTIEPQLLTSSSEYDQHSNLELPDVHDFNERTKSFATETQLQEQQSKSQNSVSTNDFELNVEDAFDNNEMDTI